MEKNWNKIRIWYATLDTKFVYEIHDKIRDSRTINTESFASGNIILSLEIRLQANEFFQQNSIEISQKLWILFHNGCSHVSRSKIN